LLLKKIGKRKREKEQKLLTSKPNFGILEKSKKSKEN